MPGITQTGVGANILVEDNANADSNLDGINGVYSFNDIGLKGLPSGDYVDNATLQKSYRSKVNIVNGDGAGTQPTTIKDSNFSLLFDNLKSLSISPTGRVNRLIELGTKYTGLRDSGGDLWRITAGGAFNLSGNVKLYGGLIQTTSGALAITPTADAPTGELVNCILQNASANVNLGLTSPFQEIYNVDILLPSSGLSALSAIQADFCERITVAVRPGALNPRFINTAGMLRVRDLVLIGTPLGDCVRYTGTQEALLVGTTWAQGVPQVTQNVVGVLGDWWPFDPMIGDEATAVPIAGCLVEVYGRSGLLLTATSDVSGRITYNKTAYTITEDCLRARYILGGTSTWIEEWPLTIYLNRDNALPQYLPRTLVRAWPFKTYLSTQKQLKPFMPLLGLVKRGGAIEDWRPTL